MEASTATQPDDGIDPAVAAALSPEAQEKVLARQEARNAAAAEKEANAGSEAQSQTAAVRKVADGKEDASDEELLDATAWFLSEEEDEEVEQEISVNLGTNSRPKKLAWVIKPVDAAVLRRARTEARMGTRAQKRAGTAEMDDAEFHKRVVLAGSVEPDLLALTGGNREKALDRLERKFKVKPLLITQISNEIVSLSGLDDEDIQEVEAAGN